MLEPLLDRNFSAQSRQSLVHLGDANGRTRVRAVPVPMNATCAVTTTARPIPASGRWRSVKRGSHLFASWLGATRKDTVEEFSETDKDGTVYWRDGDGQLHRENGPAIVWLNGDKAWFKHGKRHRENGPAVENANGARYWWFEGERHRVGGPATEDMDGRKSWYVYGRMHREDAPAFEAPNGDRAWRREGHLHREDGPAIERADGTKQWYRYSERHREDGPAIEWADGTKEWYRNGKRHREDGPAVEWADGTKEWWVDGVKQVRGSWRDRFMDEIAARARAKKPGYKTIQKLLKDERFNK